MDGRNLNAVYRMEIRLSSTAHVNFQRCTTQSATSISLSGTRTVVIFLSCDLSVAEFRSHSSSDQEGCRLGFAAKKESSPSIYSLCTWTRPLRCCPYCLLYQIWNVSFHCRWRSQSEKHSTKDPSQRSTETRDRQMDAHGKLYLTNLHNQVTKHVIRNAYDEFLTRGGIGYLSYRPSMQGTLMDERSPIVRW